MVWPHAFEAEISIRIAGRALQIELACENKGDAPLSFTAALHTYLRLTQIMSASVQGLSGLAYGTPPPSAQAPSTKTCCVWTARWIASTRTPGTT